jgi:hypothetical protein
MGNPQLTIDQRGRALGTDDNVPEPPSPTGQYPDPVWVEPGFAAAVGLDAGTDDDVPEPPSPTGQYPDPVWGGTTGGEVEQDGSSSAVASSLAEPGLAAKEPGWAEDLGEAEDAAHPEDDPSAGVALGTQDIYRIIREVAIADSGDDLYAAVLVGPGGEAGGQPAGLAFGLVLFTQASGQLGAVLELMRAREPAVFAEVFGPDADALAATATAATPAARLAPVGGEPLWGPGWTERFRRSGAVPAFQAAQNEYAIEGLFRRVMPIAAGLGLTSDRGLAMAFDRVVARGPGGGGRWLVETAGPLRTERQRAHALTMLGFADLAAFQASVAGLRADGRFGPDTHAALAGALRRQGEAPMPTPADLTSRLIAAATEPARSRLVRLRDTTMLSDVVYAVG